MEDENGRMAAMQAEFQKLREDLTSMREEVEAQREKRETATKRKAANRESEAKLERSRKERSLGTSFAGQGGGNAADRRGTAVSTMGPMWTRGVSAAGGLRQNLQNFPRGIVPKFSVECSPSEYIAWEQRFEFFVADQDLRHTISPDVPEIAVISCTNNAYLFGQFGEELVLEHRQVWWYISEATADTAVEDRLYECHSISDALRIMREWSLPFIQSSGICLWRSWREFGSWGTKNQKLFSLFSASSRNVHRTPMLLSSVVVFGTGGPWESEFNVGMTIWYLAAVACLGISSSLVVACHGSSSNSSNGLAAVVFISISVASMPFLPPDRRNSSNR